MSGFHEVRFPDNIAYGATGGPEFATTVVATGSGHEKRNVNWAEARGRWDVASGLKKQAQIDELIAFFRARRGKAYGFRFKDWTDYKATGQLLGTGDDAQTQFQLVKHYPSGSVIEVRTITKPVAGTVKVYLDGVEQLSGWSVDTTTGLVTFSTAPALGRRGHRRLRVRRAGAVRYRPHGGDHRDLPAARLAADPDRRGETVTVARGSGLALVSGGLFEPVKEVKRLILHIPPGVNLSEPEPLEERTGRPVLREYVQRRRAQAPLQHRREKRASKAGALVVGIDEQLVDVGAARCEVGYDRVLGADNLPPVPLLELPGIPMPHLILRVGPVHEPVCDTACTPMHPTDAIEIDGLQRSDAIGGRSGRKDPVADRNPRPVKSSPHEASLRRPLVSA